MVVTSGLVKMTLARRPYLLNELVLEEVNIVVIDEIAFLRRVVPIMHWGTLANVAEVMNIGCSTHNSCLTILHLYPNIRRMLALSTTPERVKLVDDQGVNYEHKIQVYRANIEDRDTLIDWEGRMNRIISIHYFQTLNNKELAFQNVHRLLRPGGGASIRFSVGVPYEKCLHQVLEMPVWKDRRDRLNIDFGGYRWFDIPDYRTMLEKIGFQIILCEVEDRIYVYHSVEMYIDIMDGQISGRKAYPEVPEEFREEFRADFLRVFEEQNGKSPAGIPQLKYQVVNILVKK